MRNPTAEPGPAHYGYIDALRGWAFLLVLAAHAAHNTAALSDYWRWVVVGFGDRGVQLFFVLSAFTLALSLDARRDHRPVPAYLVRRVFRIAPLFWSGIAFYAWWHGVRPRFYSPDGVGWPEVAAAATFTHGLWPSTINAVVPGGWSVADEMLFYLLFPALLAAARTPRAAVALFVGFWAVAALLPRVGLPWRLFPHADHVLLGDFSSYWLPSQLPVFAAGIVLYRATRPGESRGAGLALLAAAGVVILSRAEAVAEPVCYAAAFATLTAGLALAPVRPLVNGLTRWVGTVSFSCYVFHFAALDVARAALGTGLSSFGWPPDNPAAGWIPAPLLSVSHLPPGVQYVSVFATGLALTLPAAFLTYHLVEKPGIAVGRRLIRRLGW